ncbi:MAG: hypothetical protein IPH95_08465 [Candidatus Promineofilum sp.]|nr:hypothetical protein [Promineifilum sp.]
MTDDPNTPTSGSPTTRAGRSVGSWAGDAGVPAAGREREFAPGRMIVPGAGLGDDARLFARHGFQVTAVDFAPTAAQAMRARQASAAPIVILQADWFTLPAVLRGVFDYVLEYVFPWGPSTRRGVRRMPTWWLGCCGRAAGSSARWGQSARPPAARPSPSSPTTSSPCWPPVASPSCAANGRRTLFRSGGGWRSWW